MAEKPDITVWGVELQPALLCDLQSDQGAIRTRAFMKFLYERAAQSAAYAIFKQGGCSTEEAKELGKEAVVRLGKVVAARGIKPEALPTYLYAIIETVLKEKRRLVLRVAHDEFEAQHLEQVAAPTPIEESDQYPWFIRLALTAVKSSGLSDRDLDIFWTVKERYTEKQKEKTDVYEELATRHEVSRDRVRHIYFTARKKIRKRLEVLLSDYPRVQQLDFYKHVRLAVDLRQADRG